MKIEKEIAESLKSVAKSLEEISKLLKEVEKKQDRKPIKKKKFTMYLFD